MKKRSVTTLVTQSLSYFPATLLLGARQVGKSTLAEQIVNEGFIDQYLTLDNFIDFELANRDPDFFLKQFSGSIALDEIQRAPDLMRALKKTIDENRQSGRFLLTGSANILAYPGVTESLAGRVDIIHLEGLSTSELMEKPKPQFLYHLINDSVEHAIGYAQEVLNKNPKIEKSHLYEWVFYGGFPEVAIKKDPVFLQRWFNSYFTTYIERDVRDFAKVIDMVSFSKLFRLSALRTGNLLNVKNLGADVGLDQRTVARYLNILEMTFQINQLSPWFANTSKRLVKTPKLFLNDSGFACHLSGIDSPALLENHPFWGALFETWVWGEFRKQLALLTGIYSSYYRTHLGREVDFVLEKGNLSIGIELKSQTRINLKDFAGLVDFKEANKNPIAGIVFYLGDRIIPFPNNFFAVPLQCLVF